MGAASAGGGVPIVSVENSALYVPANSEYLSYTEQAGTSTNKQYISFWMYFAGSGGTNFIFSCDDGSNTNRFQMYFPGTGITFLDVKAGSVQCYLISNQPLRDIGWYHVELLIDTTQAVAFNRNILKVNNVRRTTFDTETNYGLNNTFGPLGSAGNTFKWGRSATGGDYFPGYLAESVRIDGDPAGISTGEYDETGLYWTPKSSTDIKALTFGTNGFYLDNTTNAQTDASGEGNNFTNNNSVVTSTHTPTNISGLINPLAIFGRNSTPITSNGNLSWTSDGGNRTSAGTTLGVTTGKYSVELVVTATSGTIGCELGVLAENSNESGGTYTGNQCVYDYTGAKVVDGTYTGGWAASYALGDTIRVELDVDGSTVEFFKNGASQGSLPLASGHAWFFGGRAHAETDKVTMESQTHTLSTGFAYLNTTNIAANTTRTASDTNKYFQTVLYEGNGAGQRVGAFQPFDNTFTVGNSALFNTSNYLSRTPSSTGDAKTATFSRWIKRNTTGYLNILFSAVVSGSQKFFIVLNTDNQFELYSYSGGYDFQIETTRTFLDLSQWVHFYVAIDTSESTSADRIKVYINGVQETSFATASYPSLNFNMDFNTVSVPNYLGYGDDAGGNVYSAETAWVDGTIYAPSYFGQVDTSTNRWVPKALAGITWGTNGFYQDYADSGNLGDDESGNTNDFVNNNTVVQTTDSPTTNFGTLAVKGAPVTLTNGNRTLQGGAGGYGQAISGLSFKHEKIFCALLIVDGASGASVGTGIAVVPDNYIPNPDAGAYTGSFGNVEAETLTIRVVSDIPGTAVGFAHAIAPQDGDYFTCAVDPDQGNIWFGFYDTSAGTHQYLPSTVGGTAGNPADGTLPTIPGRNFNSYDGIKIQISGYGTSAKGTLCLASGDLPISPPTDFLTFQQDNLAGTDQFISAFSWIKNRDATNNHMLFDRVRGATNDMHSNTTDIQVTNVNTVQRFLEGGVQIGNDVQVNTANQSYVLWNGMFENTGSGASNTDGSINTTSTLVDTTLGMSISRYTGTGSNATVGHGLGVAPQFVIVKSIEALATTSLWTCYHIASSSGGAIFLNYDYAYISDSTYFNSTAPTTSVFSLGSAYVTNQSSKEFIAYCFAPSQFISIGSYEGNGNANGAFVPTLNSLGVPIQPVWAITKSIDSTSNWDMYDKERLGYNPENAHLDANLTTVESTADNLDIVTGGLKMRIATDPNVAATSVYMAIGTPIIDVDGRIIAGR